MGIIESSDKKTLAQKWEQAERKELLLVPEKPFFNYVNVAVMDYPKGVENGTTRRRCKVTLEYGRVDAAQLKKKGIEEMEDVIAYYEDYLYRLVKANISSEWTAVGGMEETMDIVREHVSKYFE